MHVDDCIVDDLVHRFLDGASELARVDHGVNELKCAEDQVLKTHHLAYKQTYDEQCLCCQAGNEFVHPIFYGGGGSGASTLFSIGGGGVSAVST